MMYNDSWKEFVKQSNYLDEMIAFVENEKDICPDKDKVFRFFNCDLNNTKCIILGMDPYPATYKDGKNFRPVATGRSFEVANIKFFTDKYRQVSLANIFKALCYYKFNKKYSMDELRALGNEGKLKYVNIHDWFDAMEQSGVIFLNATLTTKKNHSGSHIKVWKDFMDELIKYIDGKINCKWLIWGEVALNRVKGIVDEKSIIYSCHPASRVNNDFIIDCCFKKIKGINWF